MPPIFKNVEVSRDDIGDHMRQYALDHDIMSQPHKSLVGSMFGEKIMVISPLLKWNTAWKWPRSIKWWSTRLQTVSRNSANKSVKPAEPEMRIQIKQL